MSIKLGSRQRRVFQMGRLFFYKQSPLDWLWEYVGGNTDQPVEETHKKIEENFGFKFDVDGDAHIAEIGRISKALKFYKELYVDKIPSNEKEKKLIKEAFKHFKIIMRGVK